MDRERRSDGKTSLSLRYRLRATAAILLLAIVALLATTTSVRTPERPSGTPAGKSPAPQTGGASPTPAALANRALSSVPLALEPNVGQAEAAVQFVAHPPGGLLLFAGSELTLTLSAPATPKPETMARAISLTEASKDPFGLDVSHKLSPAGNPVS